MAWFIAPYKRDTPYPGLPRSVRRYCSGFPQTVDNATNISAIKANTDGLTFTVAGVVDANIQRVNDVTVTGTGAPGDEWGP